MKALNEGERGALDVFPALSSSWKTIEMSITDNVKWRSWMRNPENLSSFV